MLICNLYATLYLIKHMLMSNILGRPKYYTWILKTQALEINYTEPHRITLTHTLFLILQFCVSAKTTGTVDISLWLRFNSLWSQPCYLASLKGHCCCLSKFQQKHTMHCSVCERMCVFVREREGEREKTLNELKSVCVTNMVSEQELSVISNLFFETWPKCK